MGCLISIARFVTLILVGGFYGAGGVGVGGLSRYIYSRRIEVRRLRRNNKNNNVPRTPRSNGVCKERSKR